MLKEINIIHRKRWEKVQLFPIEYTYCKKQLFAMTLENIMFRVEIFYITHAHDL